jgi:hypothetical protein
MIVLIASIVDIFVHIKQTLVMLLRTVIIKIGSGLQKHEQSQSHIVATKNFQLLKLRQELHLRVR